MVTAMAQATAVVRVWSLAWEILHAMDTEKKEEKILNKTQEKAVSIGKGCTDVYAQGLYLIFL